VDELKKVARELNDPISSDKPSGTTIEPPLTEVTSSESPRAPNNTDPKEKNRLLGKLFKKKK
jgi:hypothetical protein